MIVTHGGKWDADLVEDRLLDPPAAASPEEIVDRFPRKMAISFECRDGTVELAQSGNDVLRMPAPEHMSSPTSRDDISDNGAGGRQNQFEKSSKTLAQRVKARLGARDFAWLARQAGIPTSTLHSMLGGTMPRADNALRLARVLGCSVEWLVSGQDTVDAAPTPVADDSRDGMLDLAVFDIIDLAAQGQPRPVARYPVRRASLSEDARRCAGLWLCQMPSSLMMPLASAGDLLICTEPDAVLVDGRVYILVLDGRPMVRRVFLRSGGVALVPDGRIDQAIDVALDAAKEPSLRAIGRVVGVLAVRTP